jgi:methyl-accepting chemotaxis protein
LLKQQLAGSLSVTEEGMMGLVGSLNAIHAMSHEQLSRIQAAEQNGAALSAVVSEKIMVDEQMVLILEMFVTRQEQDIAANLTRMQRLQDVKSLEPMIEIIADVAQQTNLMSINAAILAAHAGEQGRAFGVLASAIRELSHRTAQSTRDISRTIAAATADLDQEMQAVSRVGERQSAIGNMRKVVADIRGMQTRFGDASHRMLDILERDKSGHAHLVHHLSEAMGQVQVQDILRQRVEHVEAALTELQEHAQDLAVRMRQPVWDGAGMTGLRARLDAHLDSYVMQSQRVLHQQVTGAAEAEASERPAIELF